MLKGIKQTDKELLEVINKYGCLFLCFAEASPLLFEGKAGCYALNRIWATAVHNGIVSGDLNKDGDYDDAGEAEVQNYKALAELFDLKLRYDGIHHDAKEIIPPEVQLVIGQYWWRSGHFVIINKKKEVTCDPMGVSNTVKNGNLKSMRWFYAD